MDDKIYFSFGHTRMLIVQYISRKQFTDFPLNAALCQRLQELGYSEPFEIQARTLEHTLTGRYE